MSTRKKIVICATTLMLASQSFVSAIVSAEGVLNSSQDSSEKVETKQNEEAVSDSSSDSLTNVEKTPVESSTESPTPTPESTGEVNVEPNEINEPEVSVKAFSLNLKDSNEVITEGDSFTVLLKGTLTSGSIQLPEGISFDVEENKQENGSVNESFAYDSVTRKLTINDLPEMGTALEGASQVVLTADKAQDYTLFLQNEDQSVKSESLLVAVAAKKSLKRNDLVRSAVAPILKVESEKTELSETTENTKIMGTMTYSNATTNINNGKIIVKVENGSIVSHTQKAESAWFKTVVYNAVDQTVTYTLVDGYTSGNYLNVGVVVKPGVGITSEDKIKTTYTITGTNTAGEAFEAVEESVSLDYRGPSFALVSPGSKAWTVIDDNHTNLAIYPGTTRNVYPGLVRTHSLRESFENARIVLNVSDEEFKQMLNFKKGTWTWRDNNDNSRNVNSAVTELGPTQSEIILGSLDANEVERIYYPGDITLPKNAIPGKNYWYNYDIYDGDNLIYTTKKNTITVKELGNEVNFSLASTKKQTINMEDEFIYATNLSSSGSGDRENTQVVYTIPEGVGVERLIPGIIDGNRKLINKVEYLSGNSWTEVPLTEKIYDLSKVATPISKIRVALIDSASVIGYQPIRIVMKNKAYDVGDSFTVGVDSFTYIDAMGKKQNIDTSKMNGEYSLVEKNTVKANGILFEKTGAPNFDTAIVSNGDVFTHNYRIGVKDGEIEQPYLFVKVPKGMSVLNNTNTIQYPFGSIEYTFAPSYGVTAYPIGSAENVGSFETLDKKSVVYYYKADNTNLKPLDSAQMLFIANQYTAVDLAAGNYEIEVGMGSLTKEIDTMKLSSGYSEKKLSAEIQQGLSATNSSYYSKKTSMQVGEVDKIDTEVKLKGSADKTFVNATKGEVASVVPGEKIQYDITLKNNGTNNYENFEIVNILPYVGDVLVGSNVARGSQFQINPDASGVEVFFNGKKTNATTLLTSVSSNPERFTVPSGAYVGGAPFSSSNDISAVRSLKVTLPGVTVKPGDSVQLKYTVNVPLDAKRPDKGSGEIISANNSLAYKVSKKTQNGYATLAGEPVIAKAKTTPAENNGILSGQAFIDLNKDGAVATAEPGLNQVQFELFKKVGSNYVTTGKKTESTTDGTGKIGSFGFVDLEYATYRVKVTLPKTAGAEFVTAGANGVEKIDATTAWLKKANSTDLVINDAIGATITDLVAPLYVATPLEGKILFTDKDNNVKMSEYGSDYTVVLKDATNKIVDTVKATKEGVYSFKQLEIHEIGNYTVEFSAPTDKNFVFNDALNSQSGGKLAVTLTPGLGKNADETTDIYITDTDKPTGLLALVGGIGPDKKVNPTSVKMTAEDVTTEVTTVWEIKDSAGTVEYSGSSQADLDQAIDFVISDRSYGTHTLTLAVTDAAGNTNETAISKEFIIAGKPVIKVTNPSVVFLTNEVVDEAAILAKAIATVTTQPADVPSPLKTNTTAVITDSQVTGEYIVTVSSTDANGLVAIPATINVMIKDKKVNLSYQVDGAEISSTEVNYNKVVTAPKNPVKAGYKFTGWAKADSTLWNFAVDKAPATDFILTAKFKAEGQAIKFDVNGGDSGSTPEDIAAETDAKVNIDEVAYPTRAGYTFKGWYNGDTLVSGTEVVMPAGGLILKAKWAAEDQTITFDINGGDSVVPNDISAKTDSSIELDSIEKPTKAGYTFTGWFVGTKEYKGTLIVPAGGLMLVAKWSAAQQTITFDSAGGTDVAAIKEATGELVSLASVATTKAGYTFVGWYVGDEKQETTFPMPVGGLQLTAKWTADDQLVTFNTVGGSAIADQTLKTDDVLDIDALQTEKAGYTLTGWVDEANKAVTGTVTIQAGGLALTAQWTANEQSITFDMDGGTPQQASIVKGTDEEVNLDALIKPTKIGYNFIGWFEGDTQVSGDFPMPIGGKSLVAHWTATEQVLTFDANGGTGVDSITEPTGTAVNLETAITTRAGYKFVGWFNGTTKYTGTIKMPATGLALTAKWTAEEQTITFVTDGTEVNPIKGKTDEEVNIDAVKTSKPGYRFTGWVDAEKNAVSGTKVKMPAGGMTLTATWTAENQTITFNSAKGTEVASIVEVTDKEINLSERAITTRAGYQFVGWYAGTTKYEGTLNMPAGGLALTAKWIAEEQTITFVTDGTEVNPLKGKTDEEVNIAEAITTKVGYTFAGWIDTENNPISGSVKMPAGGMTLTAIWIANNQILTFDSNGGTDVAAYTKGVTNESILLAAINTKTTRAGYRFDGWFTEIDGGEALTEVLLPEGGVTLFAHWTAEEQSITFDVNSGDVTSKPEDIRQVTDSTVTLAGLTPVREGYEFTGWLNPETDKLVAESFDMPAGGMQLVAQWTDLIANGAWKLEANDYTISLSDLKKLDTEEKLQENIRLGSKAQIIDSKTNTVVVENKDILVDTSAVIKKAGKHKVMLSYTPKSYEESTSANNVRQAILPVLAAPNSAVSKTIDITVTEEINTGGTDGNGSGTSTSTTNVSETGNKTGTTNKTKAKMLPTTGEQLASMTRIVGSLLLLVGMTIIWFRRKIRKNN